MARQLRWSPEAVEDVSLITKKSSVKNGALKSKPGHPEVTHSFVSLPGPQSTAKLQLTVMPMQQ